MSYQLPLLDDDKEFERLINDIISRVYPEDGINLYGRPGQGQHGRDITSTSTARIKAQCKLKTYTKSQENNVRRDLLKELEEELNKAKGHINPPKRFIFASTFPDDTYLQDKAESLSDDNTIVEVWGWGKITAKVWEFAEELIPIYYPDIPIRRIPGFTQLYPNHIEKLKISDPVDLQNLAIEYYRINDRDDVVLKIIANNIDVRNELVMQKVYSRISSLGPFGSVWITGYGGSGKTTILNRLAVELALKQNDVFLLNLEEDFSKSDLESIFSRIKYCSNEQQAVLCIDNPASNDEMLEYIFRHIPEYAPNIHILLAERHHRYRTLKDTDYLTYLHGEEEANYISVRNPTDQREQVYKKLFDLLQVSSEDRQTLEQYVLDERLVYVNATYRILLDLKKKQKIDFEFDWDDYRKKTSDLPAFVEGYKFVALFYLFGVRVPFSGLSKIYAADEMQKRLFLEKFSRGMNEPLILSERQDEFFKKTEYLRTKHEIISEIFFEEHENLKSTDLMIQWCENVDYTNPIETQTLIDIFGLKKNFVNEKSYIDFKRMLDVLLNEQLKEQVAQSNKLKATLQMSRFWLLQLQNKKEEALSTLEAFIVSSPNDKHSRNELARIYRSLGRFLDAEMILRQILEIDDGDLNSRTELAKVYRRLGELEKAEAVLLELLDLDPESFFAQTELAMVYVLQGKFVEAKALLSSVIKRRPIDIISRVQLAKILENEGNHGEAEAVLLEILRLKRSDLVSRIVLGKIYFEQGQFEKAEAILLESVAIDGKHLHSRTELGRVYQRLNKLDKAESILLESLAIDNERLHPRIELAKIYQRQNKLDKAEALLLESLEIDNKQLHPRTELAKIYQRQNKLDKAETVLLELLDIDKRNFRASTELAKIYQRQNKLDKAEILLLEILKIKSNDLNSRTELAKIYQRRNKLDKAVALLLESLEINDKQLHPRTELAKVYQRQGKLVEAERVLMESLEINPLDDHAIAELIAIWEKQGKKEKCVDQFSAFISQPGFQFSRYFQAPVFRFFRCCKRFGLKNEAKTVHDRFLRDLDQQNLDYYQQNFT